jgi:hypothetical protein
MHLQNLAIKIENLKEWVEIQKILFENKFVWKSESREIEYASEEFFSGEVWIMTSYEFYKSICHSHYAFKEFDQVLASKILEKYNRYRKLVRLKYGK